MKKVKCLDAHGSDGLLEKGKEYQVLQEDDSEYLIMQPDGVHSMWWLADRFKIVAFIFVDSTKLYTPSPDTDCTKTSEEIKSFNFDAYNKTK